MGGDCFGWVLWCKTVGPWSLCLKPGVLDSAWIAPGFVPVTSQGGSFLTASSSSFSRFAALGCAMVKAKRVGKRDMQDREGSSGEREMVDREDLPG